MFFNLKMKRAICHSCNYPLATCVCSDISVLSFPRDVIVLQHHKEACHAKNTVKLLSLVAPKIRVINTNNDLMMKTLENSVDAGSAMVFYPSDKSMALEDIVSAHKNIGNAKVSANKESQLSAFIFIDGSWPQAYGIWQANPWLQHCQQTHFSNPPSSKYCIRASKFDYQLSTLEAVAYALSYSDGISAKPFYDALHAMQAHRLKYQ